MRDEELIAYLKRIGTPEAHARLKHLKYLERAARSRSWEHGRPGPLDPALFDFNPNEEEEHDE